MAAYKPNKNDMKNYNSQPRGGGAGQNTVGGANLYANPTGQQMSNSYYMNRSGVNPNAYYNSLKNGNANTNQNTYSSGSSSGGGGGGGGGSYGGGYAAPEAPAAPSAPAFDANAYMQMIMNMQKQAQETLQNQANQQYEKYKLSYDEQLAKLRASVGEANANIDTNAQSTKPLPNIYVVSRVYAKRRIFATLQRTLLLPPRLHSETVLRICLGRCLRASRSCLPAVHNVARSVLHIHRVWALLLPCGHGGGRCSRL